MSCTCASTDTPKGVGTAGATHTARRLESILAQASILVTLTDITLSEANQELVRRKFLWAFNEKRADAEMEGLFAPDMSFNKAGTQAPLSQASESEGVSGTAMYLDRRRSRSEQGGLRPARPDRAPPAAPGTAPHPPPWGRPKAQAAPAPPGAPPEPLGGSLAAATGARLGRRQS